jgi:hypothetical protein
VRAEIVCALDTINLGLGEGVFMRKSLLGSRLRYLAVVAIATCVVDRTAFAQTPAPTLPANWQQLSPTDFATLVRQHFDTFKALSEADQEDLPIHGAQLFSKIDISNTPLNYHSLEMLWWVDHDSHPVVPDL